MSDRMEIELMLKIALMLFVTFFGTILMIFHALPLRLHFLSHFHSYFCCTRSYGKKSHKDVQRLEVESNHFDQFADTSCGHVERMEYGKVEVIFAVE